jgi:hypothetical protein
MNFTRLLLAWSLTSTTACASVCKTTAADHGATDSQLFSRCVRDTATTKLEEEEAGKLVAAVKAATASAQFGEETMRRLMADYRPTKDVCLQRQIEEDCFSAATRSPRARLACEDLGGGERSAPLLKCEPVAGGKVVSQPSQIANVLQFRIGEERPRDETGRLHVPPGRRLVLATCEVTGAGTVTALFSGYSVVADANTSSDVHSKMAWDIELSTPAGTASSHADPVDSASDYSSERRATLEVSARARVEVAISAHECMRTDEGKCSFNGTLMVSADYGGRGTARRSQ